MANKFVRSMNDVNQKNGVLPLDLTNENDLISTKEKQHHIRRKDDYHCLTDNIKSMKLNGKELKPDLIKNQVVSPNLAEEVNGVKVSSNGKVTINTGVMTVNGQQPDSKGDVVVSSEIPPQIHGKAIIDYDTTKQIYQLSLLLTTNSNISLEKFKETLKIKDGVKITCGLMGRLGGKQVIKDYILPNEEVLIREGSNTPEILINKVDISQNIQDDGELVGFSNANLKYHNFLQVDFFNIDDYVFPYITYFLPLNVFPKHEQ